MESAGKPLQGKIALVTGSSRGIGRVVASHLASLGAAVAVHGTTPTSAQAFNEAESLEAVARQVAEESGSEIMAVHGDLTDEKSVERVVKEVRARCGRIDILVNAAGGDIGAAGTGAPGGGRPQPNDCIFISTADIRAVIDRNLISCILTCRAVAPEMMDRRAGRIVNFSSIAASRGTDIGAIYAVAKAGVTHYTRCLAAQLREHNVQVNAVAPGPIITPRFVASRSIDESKLVKEGTLDRYGWPIEIANAVAFLCGPGSEYVSGQVLRVDGAIQLWPA